MTLGSLPTSQRLAVLMLVDYRDQREIARHLGVSQSAVSALLRSARENLGCISNAEMCRRARAGE